MTAGEAHAFATEWIAAWNSHDLDRILSHYATDIVLLSPAAARLVGDGRVAGLANLRAYWQRALNARPDLKFEFVGLRAGHECLTVLYRNQREQQCAETFEFGTDGKVVCSFACYE
jgi:ketosteroid isomerase-like protein